MLTAKQSKFIEAYKATGDIRGAIVQAGYSPKSANSIAVEANRLLKNPKIAHEIANWKAKKASEFTKDDFVDLALNDYRNLELTEPNKPRFLQLAGQAVGFIGNNDRPNQTINITQNKLEINSLPSGAKWQQLRNILESD